MKNIIGHKVRIAPSPTGRLHIGTIRCAYHNWLIAQQRPNSTFLVRIDDTDLERSQPELIQPIFDTLTKLGLNWDDTFQQSDRFDLYLSYAKRLIERGYAYRDDGCIRLKAESLSDFSCDWVDTLSGDKPSNEQIDEYSKSQVIIKSDGSPAYNFASTVDDYCERVTWIVRGVDHISNTYKQALIFRILFDLDDYGDCMPMFSHVGLVCHKTGKKLSKRDSDEMNLEGINTDALLNYVLRLGWSPTEDTKANNIIDKDKAITLFLEGGKMKSNNAKIDLAKLEWYDKKYNSRQKKVG
ncbi:glutamate--tRNA ligase family protein [bacterium]|nr:glutamate--tRNA ligase family protein [bacterium]